MKKIVSVGIPNINRSEPRSQSSRVHREKSRPKPILAGSWPPMDNDIRNLMARLERFKDSLVKNSHV